MRIISGEFKGRAIEAPEGSGTRPTIDRVRESLFSALFSLRGSFQDAMVLDAFAGSGALGLEALSRGAKRVVFYEKDPKAARVIERNMANLGVSSQRATLRKADVLESLPVSVRPPFDLVLLDPPYALEPAEVGSFLAKLDGAGALSEDAIVCYEHALSTDVSPVLELLGDSWYQASAKKYGKVAVATFCKEA